MKFKNIVNCILFILLICSCSKSNGIEIIFERKGVELLKIKTKNNYKFYKKDGRIKALEIGENELKNIKKIINGIDLVSIQFNGKEIFGNKWLPFLTNNIAALNRASVYKSTKDNRIILLFYCDDIAIDMENCNIVDDSLHQELINYLDEKGILYSMNLLDLESFGRVSYGQYDKSGIN